MEMVLNERSGRDLSIDTTYDHVEHHLDGRPALWMRPSPNFFLQKCRKGPISLTTYRNTSEMVPNERSWRGLSIDTTYDLSGCHSYRCPLPRWYPRENFSEKCRIAPNSLTSDPIDMKMVLNERSHRDLSIGTSFRHHGDYRCSPRR